MMDIEPGSLPDEKIHDSSLQTIEGVKNFLKRIKYPFLTFEDAQDILTLGANDKGVYDSWAEVLNNLELKSEVELYFHEKWLKKFQVEMRGQFNERIISIGDIGRMAVFNELNIKYMHYYDFNTDSLIWPFLSINGGILAQISGVMGSGKTDYGCKLAEYLLRHGINIITNIQFIWKKEKDSGVVKYVKKYNNLHVCTNMRDLLLKMAQLRMEKKRTVVLWDETSQFFSRRDPGKAGNIKLEKFLRLIRKLFSSIIFIEQIREGLPTVALEMRVAVYHKEGKKRLYYGTKKMVRTYNEYFKSVERTILPFKTFSIGAFSINIDIEKLFTYLNKYPDDDQIKRMIMYLENPDNIGIDDISPVDKKHQEYLKFIRKGPGKAITIDPEFYEQYVRPEREREMLWEVIHEPFSDILSLGTLRNRYGQWKKAKGL